MSRRVLHPTDFSKASAAAFTRSLAVARESRGDLVLVHVLSPIMPMAGAGEAYVTPRVYEEMNASARAWAQKQLDRLLAKARARHGQVASGRFGADMQVHLINDGPVTFLLET